MTATGRKGGGEGRGEGAGTPPGPRPVPGSLATVVALAVLVLATGPAACAARGPVDAGAEDRRISDEVREIAAEVEGLDVDGVRVETRDGVVTLSGVQSSWEVVSELLERVGRVRGVREVVNRIRVIGSLPGVRPGGPSRMP